jgi:hypothetical protein
MLYKSQLLTEASGSVGGCTFSHNRAGLYIRQRTLPTNPNSAGQVSVRSVFTTLAQAWSQDLTQLMRDGWDAYAAVVTKTGKLGDQIFLTGFNWYLACNTPRLQAGQARADVPPSTFSLTTLTAPTMVVLADDTAVLVSFTNTDEWATGVGGFLFLYMGQAQNVTVNFYKTPFRFMGFEAGAVVPPTSPQGFTNPYGNQYAANQRVFMRAVASAPDGRISAPVIVNAVTT